MRSLTRTVAILLLITTLAVGAILYAKGYRFSRDENGHRIVAGTGLLVLTSNPDGARVILDGELVTATNNTINLKPGTYNVKIEKDGYFSWEKKVEIENQRVTETNALLFPKAPQLESLTTDGIKNPTLDPKRHSIAYTVSSASADLNGIYIMSLNRGIIPIGDTKRQLANNLTDVFSDSTLEFSPDGTELLATIQPGASSSARIYLVKTSEFNPSPLLVTNTADDIRLEWEAEKAQIFEDKVRSLSKGARNLVNTYFSNPIFSPDEDKILYTASASATLPRVINPQIPSTNSTPEVRNIIEGNLYVYNIKDDRNYLLAAKNESGGFPEHVWHTDNRHLYYVNGGKINVVEYDGHNRTTVYAGPFLNNFITPWLDGTGIVILTSFNDPSIPPNLYRVIFK